MSAFLNMLGFLCMLLFLALSALGITSWAIRRSGQRDQRRRLAEEARRAEWEIAEVSRQAQVDMLMAALGKAARQRSADVPPSGQE